MTGQTIKANGIDIAYDEFGDRSDPTILLVMGLGTQMIAWPEPFCEDLADRGYHVLRFDNRDIGLSQKFDHEPHPNIYKVVVGSLVGWPPRVPYKLKDMAEDTVGLLDALDINAVHIVGASMGGMISQLFAAHYPERCLSLTSIMSSSGRRGLERPKPEVSKRLVSRPTDGDPEARMAYSMETYRLIGSPAFPPSDDELKRKILRSIERSNHTRGYFRQLVASIASGSRVADLRRITAPSLVLHGQDDPLVPVSHGVDTARWIPGARLEVIEGWGHDLPRELLPRFAELIDDHARTSGITVLP